MAERHDRQSALVAPAPPVKKFIPYGQFTDIDQRYYDPVEDTTCRRGIQPRT